MTETSHLELTRFFGPIVYGPIETRAKRAIVFLDGVQPSGVTPGITIGAFLMEYGDLIQVQYPERIGFSSKKAARQILDEIQHYEEVVFIGLSLGGLLAHDIIALAKRRKLNISFRLVPVCAPSGGKDLKDPKAKWTPFIPALPLPRIISRKFLFDGPFPDFAPDLDEAGRGELERHEQNSRTYRFAPWIRQIAYIVRHPGLDEDVLEGVPTVYLHTKTDPYIKRRARVMWSAAHWDGPLREVLVDIDGHCNLLAYPELWIAGLKEAFDKMGLAPLELAA